MISSKNLEDIPTSPGCYLFKDVKGEIIYVGKAKHLRKRVSSYFQKKDHDSKTALLVSDIHSIEFIVTSTEVEALLLENTLIKKHYPKYNIDLKDSQKYAYIHLTDYEFPWIEVEHTKNFEGEFFGPFVSAAIRKNITDVLSRNFKILTNKPSSQLRKAMDKEIYAKRVVQARKILKGNVDELISDLKKEMSSASGNKYYEHALTLRNQISALESLKEKQYVEFSKAIDSSIVNYVVLGEEVFLLVFSIRKGVLECKQEYSFPYTPEFLDEFILRFFDSAPIPQELIIPDKVDPALEEYLSKKKGRKVSIIVPEMGDKKQLLELVMKNVMATYFSGRERLIELQKSLSLTKLPSMMECFDISHLGGTNTVASMVSFKDGIPDKSNYRRFKIRSPVNGDDYWAMKEVLERRYSKVLRENLRKPDLIIIDGGLGQLHIGVKVLKDLKLSIPIISLAKQFEEVYIPNKSAPIRLPRSNKGLQTLQAIRDEAHRFANSYQAILRRKELIGK